MRCITEICKLEFNYLRHRSLFHLRNPFCCSSGAQFDEDLVDFREQFPGLGAPVGLMDPNEGETGLFKAVRMNELMAVSCQLASSPACAEQLNVSHPACCVVFLNLSAFLQPSFPQLPLLIPFISVSPRKVHMQS